jgi:hypothetical protein
MSCLRRGGRGSDDRSARFPNALKKDLSLLLRALWNIAGTILISFTARISSIEYTAGSYSTMKSKSWSFLWIAGSRMMFNTLAAILRCMLLPVLRMRVRNTSVPRRVSISAATGPAN